MKNTRPTNPATRPCGNSTIDRKISDGTAGQKPAVPLVEKRSITEEEWRFTPDRLTDNELVPCLIWEFLRESQTVRSLVAEWADQFKLGKDAPDQAPLSARTQKLKVVINYPIRFDNMVSCIVSGAFGLNKLFEQPWQSLNPVFRQQVIGWGRINPAAFIGYDLHAGLLCQALLEKKAANPAPAVIPARAMIPILRKGCEAVVLVIDWAHYDDNEIAAAFDNLQAELVKRPDRIDRQVRKGSGLQRLAEWRAKLNDLGLARLSARYQARQLKQVLPEAYNFIAATLSDEGPTAVEKKLAAARRRFRNSFREILPFEKRDPLCFAQSVRFSRKTRQTSGV